MFTNKQRIVDPCNKYITSQAIQLCLLETASITYLCSCEELRDQRELSQRWTPWGEVPESCESVAASPSSSSVLSVDSWVSGVTKLLLLLWSEWAQFGSDIRGETQKQEAITQRHFTDWVNLWQQVECGVCCSCRSQCFFLEWLDYFSELVVLRTSAADWTGLDFWVQRASSSPSIPLKWREGSERVRHTHSRYPPSSLILFHSLSPSHTLFLWKRSESFLQLSRPPLSFFLSSAWSSVSQ